MYNLADVFRSPNQGEFSDQTEVFLHDFSDEGFAVFSLRFGSEHAHLGCNIGHQFLNKFGLRTKIEIFYNLGLENKIVTNCSVYEFGVMLYRNV